MTQEELTDLVKRAVAVRGKVCSLRNELTEICQDLEDSLNNDNLSELSDAVDALESAEGCLDEVFKLDTFPSDDPKTWKPEGLVQL